MDTTEQSGRRATKIHAAVDTLGELLALRVSPANEDDREQVGKLAQEIQQATGENVELAYVDQGYTAEKAATKAGEKARHPPGGSQARGGKAGFCAAAQKMGSRARFRVGIEVSEAGQRLREAS